MAILERVRSPLSFAGGYLLVQRLMGARAVHRHLVEEHARVEPGDSVLDIGCGPGGLLEVLPDVTYVGLDPSAEYVEAARRRYGARAVFRHTDAAGADLEEDGRFDVVFAVGVVHHLDDAEAAALIRLAAGALAPGGRFVTLDPALVPGQPALARFLATRDRGAHVRSPEAYRRAAQRSFESVDATVHDGLARLPYTHVALRCEGPRPPGPAKNA